MFFYHFDITTKFRKIKFNKNFKRNLFRLFCSTFILAK
jgi:hypothetical protein